jgi:hypothetical protein
MLGNLLFTRLSVVLLALTVGSARRPRVFSTQYALRRAQRLLYPYAARLLGGGRTSSRGVESPRRTVETT